MIRRPPKPKRPYTPFPSTTLFRSFTTAKGITNAVVPMGAVFCRDGIYDAFMDAPDNSIELFHGYTYSGHPLACAAGLATIDLYKDEGLFERAAELAPYWADGLHSLKDGNHRSEEHTSELQSLMRISYAVFCLNKKTTSQSNYNHYNVLSNTLDKLHLV